jgi:hypothetical protein
MEQQLCVHISTRWSFRSCSSGVGSAPITRFLDKKKEEVEEEEEEDDDTF